MNDLEEMLTAHLERTAARAEPRPDLDRVLHAAGTSTATAPPAAGHVRRNGWFRPLLAVAAAAAVVGGTVISVRLATGTSSDQPPVTMTPGATDDPGTTPSTSDDVRFPAQGSLGSGGYAVLGADRVTVHRGDGSVVGDGPFTPDAGQPIGGFEIREEAGDLVLSPTEEDAYVRLGLSGEDCAELDSADDATVETCRMSADDTFGRELVYVTADGTRRTLTTIDDLAGSDATLPAAGHWARAALSPDGAWIAAERSGECEVPTVFLIRVSDGTILGPDATPLAENPEPEQSRLVGWDGTRALVATSQSECGSATAPGVHAVDPDAGTSAELTPLAGAGGTTTDVVLPWHRQS